MRVANQRLLRWMKAARNLARNHRTGERAYLLDAYSRKLPADGYWLCCADDVVVRWEPIFVRDF